MKILALAALAAASLAQAQPPETGTAADPTAQVPRPTDRPLLQDLPRGVETRQEDWKRANAGVGQFPRGHADLLKWEEAQRPRPPASAGSQPREVQP